MHTDDICMYGTIYVCIYTTHTGNYLSLSICRSFSRTLTALKCDSPTSRSVASNNSSSSYNNDNYILIQNAHLPHFNFHTLTSTSVLYMYLWESKSGCFLFLSHLGLSQCLLVVGVSSVWRSFVLSSFSIVRCSSCHFLAAIIVAVGLKQKNIVVFATLGRAERCGCAYNKKIAAVTHTQTEAHAWRKFCMPLHAWLSECLCRCTHTRILYTCICVCKLLCVQ